MNFIFEPNDTILFQGDSITDCSRNKLSRTDLGEGYVNFINHYIEVHFPDSHITCYNKGIYGNRTVNLKRRWRRSTLSLSPDILSILAGINDTWRRYDMNLVTSNEKFKDNYLYLINKARENNPNLKLVLMSPFLLPTSTEQLEWFEDLNPKIEIVKEIAQEYHAIYIPLQEIFNSQVTLEKPNCYWTLDGVHPTLEGHALIAKEWILATTLKEKC